MLWCMRVNIYMADTLINVVPSDKTNLWLKLLKYYTTYNVYDVEERRVRKLTKYSYYDHFVAEKAFLQSKKTSFNIEVTKENTDNTEKYIINFNLSYNLKFYDQFYTDIYLIGRQNREVIYFNQKSVVNWFYNRYKET